VKRKKICGNRDSLCVSILHGNLVAIPRDIFEGGAAVGGVEGFARLLENPKIAGLLTSPTERDLAQIPPDLRAEMPAVIQEAQRHGIKVSSLLTALVGTANRPQTKSLKQLREEAQKKKPVPAVGPQSSAKPYTHVFDEGLGRIIPA
jgi:hypothetical protein